MWCNMTSLKHHLLKNKSDAFLSNYKGYVKLMYDSWYYRFDIAGLTRLEAIDKKRVGGQMLPPARRGAG